MSQLGYFPPDTIVVPQSEDTGPRRYVDRPSHFVDYDDAALLFTTQPRQLICGDNQTPSLPGGVSECLKLEGFPQAPQDATCPDAICIQESPERTKGIGLFAARDIPMGELVLAERPIIVMPRRAWKTLSARQGEAEVTEETLVMMQKWRGHVEKLVDRLSPENRETYFRLANAMPESCGKPLGIALTNAVEIGMLYPEDDQEDNYIEYAGVFKKLSLLNHSPNTTISWQKSSFSLRLFTVRDIKQGEELTNTFCNIFAPAASRRASLARHGIVCLCACCRAPDAETQASDARRRSLGNVALNHEYTLQRWISKPDKLPDNFILKLSLARLADFEAEGLEGEIEYMTTLWLTMRCYMALEDAGCAEVWEGAAEDAEDAGWVYELQVG
ncbi:hypothetical protein HGRIS_006613 [Hohenbuehelia grisea]|uniref:SET domain-containing protein n=1 Tax=Hohenbuehelia grisea TaxID=104357 RepID=A0ABR3JA26_9AGAR